MARSGGPGSFVFGEEERKEVAQNIREIILSL